MVSNERIFLQSKLQSNSEEIKEERDRISVLNKKNQTLQKRPLKEIELLKNYSTCIDGIVILIELIEDHVVMLKKLNQFTRRQHILKEIEETVEILKIENNTLNDMKSQQLNLAIKLKNSNSNSKAVQKDSNSIIKRMEDEKKHQLIINSRSNIPQEFIAIVANKDQLIIKLLLYNL